MAALAARLTRESDTAQARHDYTLAREEARESLQIERASQNAAQALQQQQHLENGDEWIEEEEGHGYWMPADGEGGSTPVDRYANVEVNLPTSLGQVHSSDPKSADIGHAGNPFDASFNMGNAFGSALAQSGEGEGPMDPYSLANQATSPRGGQFDLDNPLAAAGNTQAQAEQTINNPWGPNNRLLDVNWLGDVRNEPTNSVPSSQVRAPKIELTQEEWRAIAEEVFGEISFPSSSDDGQGGGNSSNGAQPDQIGNESLPNPGDIARGTIPDIGANKTNFSMSLGLGTSFGKGYLKGFFQDGMGGTLETIGKAFKAAMDPWGTTKWAWDKLWGTGEYLYENGGDLLEMGGNAASLTAEFYYHITQNPIKMMELVINGESSYSAHLSPELNEALTIAHEIFNEIIAELDDALKDLAPELVAEIHGRIAGLISYTTVESMGKTALTGGLGIAGVYAHAMSQTQGKLKGMNIPNLSPEKIEAIFDKLLDKVKQGLLFSKRKPDANSPKPKKASEGGPSSTTPPPNNNKNSPDNKSPDKKSEGSASDGHKEGVESGPNNNAESTPTSIPSTDTGKWGKGSFDSEEASLLYHFERHGSEVGAIDAQQYLRKAEAFMANLKGAKKAL